MKDLILVGGGGHCESVIDVAESAGYHILGILDMPEFLGKEVFSYKVIGSDDDIPSFASIAQFVVTVGAIKNPKTRIKLFDRIKSAGGTLATIVASTAYVSKYAQLGEGTVVMHKAFVNAGSKIGANTIINTLANIEHDCVVGNHCHVSTVCVRFTLHNPQYYITKGKVYSKRAEYIRKIIQKRSDDIVLVSRNCLEGRTLFNLIRPFFT